MRYSYWINFNKASPSWAEFWPNKEAIATNERPDEQEFYREEIDELKIKRAGPGRNSGQDNIIVYDTLETWFFNDTKFIDEIEIEIYRGTRAGTLYYEGFFSVSDSSINKEYSIFTIVPRIDDEYRSIFEDKDTRYNIRGAGMISGEDVGIPILRSIPNWVAGSPNATMIDFDTFTVGANNNILTSVIDTDGANEEARHFVPAGLVNGSAVIINVTAYTLNAGVNPTLNIVDAADASATVGGAQAITGTGNYVFRVNAAPAGVLLYTAGAPTVTNFSVEFYVFVSGTVILNSGGLYMDFIEGFITNISFMGLSTFAGNVKSTFINNDALPSDAPSTIGTFITSNPNGNYVSLVADNPLNELIISETREFVDGDTNEHLVSFSDLMFDIRCMECGWYIDADGDFRIEHIKYFEKLIDDSTALDLTGAAYEKYKPNKDANKLTFNKSLLANREQFEWQQNDVVANSEDFIGVDIIYENLETIENVSRHEMSRITTDVQYLIENVADASANGFTYLQCILNGGDYIVDVEEGVLSGDIVSNGHMSWANLQDKYWTWRRMSENGDMNDGDTTSFDSAVKFLEQSNVKFGLQTTLNGFTKITTSQGTGQQIETVRNLDTDFLTILLAYNPY